MRIKKSQIYTRILLIIGILLLINILSTEFYFRLDWTADKRYTLSKATKQILSEVKEPVTVNAYFSDDLRPELKLIKSEFRDLLVEYDNLSSEPFVYNFTNPNKSEEEEQKAQRKGIPPMLMNVRERDQVQQKRVYMGAVVQMGEKSEVIPAIQPNTSMEYALSTAIKKLAVKDKPKIAFLQGQGEPPLKNYQQAQQALSVLYSTTDYRFDSLKPIPDDIKVLIIDGPKDSFENSELQKLDKYISNGGNLLLCNAGVQGQLRNQTGTAKSTGLESWLEKKGITLKKNFVITPPPNCGNVTVQQSRGGMRFNTQIYFPYFPIITNFSDHPITKGLESVFLPFTSEIEFNNDSSLNIKVLARTGDVSGTQPVPVYFDVNKNWQKRDFPRSGIPVAVSLEGSFGGGKPARMVVIANDNFAASQGNQQIMEDNVNLLVNAVDWLSDETGLVELRTKSISSRPIETVDDAKKTFIKYANAFGPVLLIIIIGIVRIQIQKNKRKRWMREEIV